MVRKELKYNLKEKKFVLLKLHVTWNIHNKNTNLMYDFDSEGNLKSISILLIDNNKSVWKQVSLNGKKTQKTIDIYIFHSIWRTLSICVS